MSSKLYILVPIKKSKKNFSLDKKNGQKIFKKISIYKFVNLSICQFDNLPINHNVDLLQVNLDLNLYFVPRNSNRNPFKFTEMTGK